MPLILSAASEAQLRDRIEQPFSSNNQGRAIKRLAEAQELERNAAKLLASYTDIPNIGSKTTTTTNTSSPYPQDPGFEVNILYSKDETLDQQFLTAVNQNKSTHVIKEFLKRGAYLYTTNDKNCNALYLACDAAKGGDSTLLKFLAPLFHDEDLTKPISRGITNIWSYIIQTNNLIALETLFETRANTIQKTDLLARAIISETNNDIFNYLVANSSQEERELVLQDFTTVVTAVGKNSRPQIQRLASLSPNSSKILGALKSPEGIVNLFDLSLSYGHNFNVTQTISEIMPELAASSRLKQDPKRNSHALHALLEENPVLLEKLFPDLDELANIFGEALLSNERYSDSLITKIVSEEMNAELKAKLLAKVPQHKEKIKPDTAALLLQYLSHNDQIALITELGTEFWATSLEKAGYSKYITSMTLLTRKPDGLKLMIPILSKLSNNSVQNILTSLGWLYKSHKQRAREGKPVFYEDRLPPLSPELRSQLDTRVQALCA